MTASPAACATRIDAVFAAARTQSRTAFMPFVTAGDPSLDVMLAAIRRLADAGVDLIEVGFPYSDPIADGPVIQASYTRALSRGVTVDAIFRAVGTLDGPSLPPLVAMVSYAILIRRGVQRFVDDAAGAGFAGFIVPDLPAAEAAELFQIVRDRQLDLIQLVAPTTTPDRIHEILDACSGFVYCLAVAGVTGEREGVAAALLNQLEWLRTQTPIPLAAGFGISRPEHVRTLRRVVDGVIVGTAVVKRIEGAEDDPGALEGLSAFAREMVSACHG